MDPKQSGKLNPIEKAAIFYVEFVRIHPFPDGNKRTGRIMANLILMKNNMPTVTVKAKRTEEYLSAMNKAIHEHEIDDMIGIFTKAVYESAKKIDGCLNFIKDNRIPKSNVKDERIK